MPPSHPTDIIPICHEALTLSKNWCCWHFAYLAFEQNNLQAFKTVANVMPWLVGQRGLVEIADHPNNAIPFLAVLLVELILDEHANPTVADIISKCLLCPFDSVTLFCFRYFCFRMNKHPVLGRSLKSGPFIFVCLLLCISNYFEKLSAFYLTCSLP